MTSASSTPHLVFDTTCLSHFARADRLDVLGDLLAKSETSVPHAVREEIRDGIALYPALAQILGVEWLNVVPLDTLDRLRRFTIWTSRVGAGNLVDALASTGRRLPCTGAEFPRFAIRYGLL